MVIHEFHRASCSSIAKQAFAEAGLDQPTSYVPFVAIQIALHDYEGGSVHTETDENGVVCLVASAPFENFATPTDDVEVSESVVHFNFLRNLQAILGRPVCRYRSDDVNKLSTVVIPITQDLASVC